MARLLLWSLAVKRASGWAYDVALEDGRAMMLHFRDVACDESMIVKSWLDHYDVHVDAEAERGLVQALTETIPQGDAEKTRWTRSCGWAANKQGFDVVNEDPRLRDVRFEPLTRFLDVGCAQSWWFHHPNQPTAVDAAWLHVDRDLPASSRNGEYFHFEWRNASNPAIADRIRVLRHDATRLPMFADGSVDAVFAEHFAEHLKPPDLVRGLREWWRVVRVGGVIRISMPDLRVYAEGRADADGYGTLGQTQGAGQLSLAWEPKMSWATLLNDLFRNWDHEEGWLWDWDSFLDAATLGAGLPQMAVRRSTFDDPTLPSELQGREAGWRQKETLYVTINKLPGDLPPR